MLRIKCLWLFYLMAGSVLAQPSLQWAKTFGGTNSDEAFDILSTPDGGCLVVGEAASNDGTAFGNHGSIDAMVIKQNQDGSIQWKKMLGGPDWDGASKAILASDGSYMIAGYSASTAGDVSGNHGDFDAWIVKLDPNGNIIWQKCYGGTKREMAYTILETKDKGYVFAGFSASTDGDLTMNQGFYDAWIVKIDSDGILQWQRSYGGSHDDRFSSILQMADGGYMVSGSAGSADGNVSMSFGGPDYWLLRLNDDGKILWQKSYGGSGIDVGSAVIAAGNGRFYIFGQTFSEDGQVTGNHGLSDLWLIQTDSLGELQWEKSYGGSDADYPGGSLLDNGTLVLSGGASSNDGNLAQNTGGFSFWIFGVDNQGNIQWQNTYGGSEAEVCFGLSATQEGGFFISGYTWSNDGDVSGQHGAYDDYWVIKLAQKSSATEAPQFEGLQISPNPATTTITFSIPVKDIDYQGEIYDSAGRVMQQKHSEGARENLEWDISDLPQGLYFLKISNAISKPCLGRFLKE